MNWFVAGEGWRVAEEGRAIVVGDLNSIRDCGDTGSGSGGGGGGLVELPFPGGM